MSARAVQARTITNTVGPSAGPGLTILAFIEILLLSVWLGSMIFFSFAVAPSAFAVLDSNELAGRVVTRLIIILEVMGVVLGPFLIATGALAWRATRGGRTAKAIRLTLLAIMTAAAAVSLFEITPSMAALRESFGAPIEAIAADDPLRVHFNELHKYSVALMSTAIFAGIVALFLSVRSWFRR
jgi:hypothetical protein